MVMENRSLIFKTIQLIRVGGKSFRQAGLFLILFITLFTPFSKAQEESAIRRIIEDRDLRKLDKADKVKYEADRNAEESTRLKQEIRTIQHDSDLNDRMIKRKARLLETKSWQNEVQTSALYAKSNGRKYNIYKKYLSGFWKDHEGQEAAYLNAKMLEEQARDNFAQATVYRRKTKHMNLGLAKIEKLTEANNLESVAIRRQVASLADCYGISQTLSLAAISDSTAVPRYTEQDTQSVVVLKPVTEPVQIMEDKPAIAIPVIPVVKPSEPPLTVPVKEDRVIFRIQIAASRLLLTFQELSKINPGNYPVEAVSEGGWFKYQLIGVPFFSDAQRIFHEANAKGSFIVAYRNGQKQNPADLIKENKELEKRIRGEGKAGSMEETEYHVELLASKTPLKSDQTARLYHGPEPVLLIMEKGLYEYHLNAGNSSETAEVLKQQSGVAGAVIVAYKNAIRMNRDEIR
jgi:hypothetical protein